MAKKKSFKINERTLSLFLFGALIIEFVLPVIKLGRFSWIATLIYLLVAIYLFFF